jgi:hypothetical protein
MLTVALMWSCAGSGATASTSGPPTDCPPPGDSPGAPGVGDPVLPFIGNGGYEVSHYDLELFIVPHAII